MSYRNSCRQHGLLSARKRHQLPIFMDFFGGNMLTLFNAGLGLLHLVIVAGSARITEEAHKIQRNRDQGETLCRASPTSESVDKQRTSSRLRFPVVSALGLPYSRANEHETTLRHGKLRKLRDVHQGSCRAPTAFCCTKIDATTKTSPTTPAIQPTPTRHQRSTQQSQDKIKNYIGSNSRKWRTTTQDSHGKKPHRFLEESHFALQPLESQLALFLAHLNLQKA